MLHVQNAIVALRGKQVAEDISFRAGEGELIAVIGPNGAGKTSLLKAIAGLLPLERGDINIDTIRVSDMPASSRAKRLAYMPQGHPLHWPLSVEALTWLGRGLESRHALKSTLARAENEQKCRSALEHMGLWDKRSLPVQSLSGGEQARAHLSRLFASDAPLWLLDEPIAALDPFYQMTILKSLKAAKEAGRTIIIVLHNLDHVALVADRILAIKTRQIGFGSPDEILTSDFISRLYGLKVGPDLRFDLSL